MAKGAHHELLQLANEHIKGPTDRSRASRHVDGERQEGVVERDLLVDVSLTQRPLLRLLTVQASGFRAVLGRLAADLRDQWNGRQTQRGQCRQDEPRERSVRPVSPVGRAEGHQRSARSDNREPPTPQAPTPVLHQWTLAIELGTDLRLMVLSR